MVSGLRYETARDLFAARPCAARDMTTVPTGQPSLAFCRFLLEGETPEEAVTFCAYLLPERPAVWWAHECLGHLGELLDEDDMRLLGVIADWVAAPEDGSLRAALAETAVSRPMTPAGRLAAAAVTAGANANSMLESACAVASGVNASILTALARVAISDRFPLIEAFVEMGTQLAETEAARQPAVAR
jgi:hypothetical protein